MKIYKTYLEIYYSKHRIVTKSEVKKNVSHLLKILANLQCHIHNNFFFQILIKMATESF